MASVPGRGKRAIFCLILIVTPVLITELSLQVIYYLTTGGKLAQRMVLPIFEADEHRCYRLISNLNYVHQTPEYGVRILTNEQGFRTDESRATFEVPKPDGVYRILLLGPSFAFGWGSEYEDSFAALVGEALHVPTGEIEIVNAGTPAQGQSMQLCWLREEGYKLQPDLVLYTHYGFPTLESNDCETAICPIVDGGFLHGVETSLSKAMETAKRSAIIFYTWYYYTYFTSTTSKKTEGLGLELRPNVTTHVDTDDVDHIVRRYNQYAANVWRYARREVPVVVVQVPPAFFVHPEDRPRWAHRGGLVEPAAVMRNQQVLRQLESRLRGDRITFVDPTPELREASKRERMYYWLDIHLTPAGNAAVADALMTDLQRIVSGDGSSNQALK